MADLFCDTEVEDFVPLDCGIELGGFIGMGLIHSSESPTVNQLQDPSFWEGKFGVSPQRYWNIPETRGSYAGGTPTETAGYGRKSTRRTGADHEAVLEVAGLSNRDFWEKVNQRTTWHVVLITNGGKMLYVRDASIWAKIMVDEDIKSEVRFNVSVKWQNFSLPEVLNEPVGIFD